MSNSSTYAFGDNDLALQRLQVLAAAFAPSTRSFLQAAVRKPISLAVDLGCGPGYTTHLLQAIAKPKQSVGLDSSERFIASATRTATKQVGFQLHDVTRLPLPTGPADLLFARLLLPHLAELQAVVQQWSTQLRSGGLLLLEEVDSIQTENPTFKTYLPLVDAILKSPSKLYIGPELAALPAPPNFQRRLNRIFSAPIPTGMAAKMFHLNLSNWKEAALARGLATPQQLVDLEHALLVLTTQTSRTPEIEWRMRQLVYERA